MIGMRAALPRNERRHPVSRVGGAGPDPRHQRGPPELQPDWLAWPLGYLPRETAGAKINPQVYSVPEGTTS